MLLSTAYFPPIEYFALLAEYSVVYIEACERYEKQSWRNRCRILTANGPMDLNYPVVHSEKKGITDVEVDWSTPWLSRTEYAIDSAYMSSPFFEYYRDELYAILDSQPRTLWDMNYRIIGFFCRKIGITPEIVPSSSFVREVDDDYRYLIHPKKKNTIMADKGLERPYWQVFNDRYGFTPGLSIMDLVFNEGPESICWLRK